LPDTKGFAQQDYNEPNTSHFTEEETEAPGLNEFSKVARQKIVGL
jgi:hypothetical protein